MRGCKSGNCVLVHQIRFEGNRNSQMVHTPRNVLCDHINSLLYHVWLLRSLGLMMGNKHKTQLDGPFRRTRLFR